MTKRTGEFGSRVPKNFSSSLSPIGVADLFGKDISDPSEAIKDWYQGYWYYPTENDINLSLKSGSGNHYFLSYSDQALYTDDKIDNYFDILDYNPNEDFLILPFLTSDEVEITQENNFIIADLGSGKKDKIFKLSQKAKEGNVGFADQFDSINMLFNGNFQFSKVSADNSYQDNGIEENNAVSKPGSYTRKSADKITNFNSSIDALEIDAESFGIDSFATFAVGRNKKVVKKKLAKQDFDFLYDQKKGGLYFNENGADKGFGDGGIIAILKGAPGLTAGNLEFI